MKRLIFKTILLILVPVVLVSAFMLFSKDNYTIHSHEKNVLLSYNKMKALGDTTKMVIIAGSNGCFGINSHILKESFNLPVVNTSTHAGMGSRLQFEIYRKLLHSGDVVIFCPEYYIDKSSFYGESTVLRVLSTFMPEAYLKMSWKQSAYLFKYIGIHFKECLKDRNAKEFDGPYSLKALNEFGDIEYERKHIKIRDTYKFKGKMDEDALDYYKDVHAYCKEKGIKLVFLPPVLLKSNYMSQKSQIDSLNRQMDSNGISYLVPPQTFVFPDSDFTDTAYHMTSEGANQRTQLLVKILKKYKILKQ